MANNMNNNGEWRFTPRRHSRGAAIGGGGAVEGAGNMRRERITRRGAIQSPGQQCQRGSINKKRRSQGSTDIIANAREVANFFKEAGGFDSDDDDVQDDGLSSTVDTTDDASSYKCSTRNSAKSMISTSGCGLDTDNVRHSASAANVNYFPVDPADEPPRKRQSSGKPTSRPSLTRSSFTDIDGSVVAAAAAAARSSSATSSSIQADPDVEMSDVEMLLAAEEAANALNEEKEKRITMQIDNTELIDKIGPLEGASRRQQRRRAVCVSSIAMEAQTAQNRRMELLMKDRNEKRKNRLLRTGKSSMHQQARRSLSHTSGLQMSRSIFPGVPEETEPEQEQDLLRLSRSKMERRVLSLPDPNACIRLSHASINDDVDLHDVSSARNESALSATLNKSIAGARASLGNERFSAASYRRPSFVNRPHASSFLEQERYSMQSFDNRFSIQSNKLDLDRENRFSIQSNNWNPTRDRFSIRSDHVSDFPSDRLDAFDDAIAEEGLSNTDVNTSLDHNIPPYPRSSLTPSTTYAPNLKSSAAINNADTESEKMPPPLSGISSLPPQNISLPQHFQQHQFHQQQHSASANLHAPLQSSLLRPPTYHNPYQRRTALISPSIGSALSAHEDLQETISSPSHQVLQQEIRPSAPTSQNDPSIIASQANILTSNLPYNTQTPFSQGDALVAAVAAVRSNALAAQSLTQATATAFLAQQLQSQEQNNINLESSLHSIANNDIVDDSFDGKKSSVIAYEPTPDEQQNVEMIRRAIEMDDTVIEIYMQNDDRTSRLLLDDSENDATGDVAMHVAAQHGSTLVLDALFNKDKNSALIRNSIGFVPLHIAVKSGNFAAVSSICRNCPASTRVQCEEGCLPLHEAVSSAAHHQDAPQITAVILEAFPEAVKVTTDEGLLPIHLAAMSGFAAGLRTIFAKNFETMYSREPTEFMLPLDFAIDGLSNEMDTDAAEAARGQDELLSVAHQQPLSSALKTDLESNFSFCAEILLISNFYGRPILSPRDGDKKQFPFLPLHGAVVANPLPRTWKRLLSLYAADHIGDKDGIGRNVAHHLCCQVTDEIDNIIDALKDVHQIKADLFSQPDNYGFLPLHICVLNKSAPLELVKAVLELNYSALSVEVRGQSGSEDIYQGLLPFQIAAVSGCDENIIFLMLRDYPVLNL